jgi:hypothetical protein
MVTSPPYPTRYWRINCCHQLEGEGELWGAGSNGHGKEEPGEMIERPILPSLKRHAKYALGAVLSLRHFPVSFYGKIKKGSS